ncbi:MAG: mechanosensitive ion channel domain-containing protein [Burkholderiales bacterium]
MILAVCANTANAQGASTAASAPSPTAATTIATTTATIDNADIGDRIRSIFSEIEVFRGVRVRVSAGVVTLDGKVPNTADAVRAEAIATRVSGVVTVQNNLERNLDLDTNLTPALGQFGAHLRSLVHALPLVGVAFAIGLVIVMLGYWLAAIGRLWRWLTPNPFMAELAATFLRFASIVLGLIAALEVLGATALLGGVLGGAGVIGIALGFAVRDTVDNYVSSLMLSLRQPFRANDHVVIEAHEGRVIRLTSRATILMTLDGNHVRIPNSIVFKSVILNYTRNAQRRFSFDLGVDADDNPLDGMAVGLAAVNALEFVLDSPAATAIIWQVGDSNIVLRFHGWIDQNDTDFMKGRSLAIQAAKAALEAAGFALPEPIYRLRFDPASPLPLPDTLQSAAAEPRHATPRVKGTDAAAAADTRPDSHIERLVDEERAGRNEDDLLDSARPIE